MHALWNVIVVGRWLISGKTAASFLINAKLQLSLTQPLLIDMNTYVPAVIDLRVWWLFNEQMTRRR